MQQNYQPVPVPRFKQNKQQEQPGTSSQLNQPRGLHPNAPQPQRNVAGTSRSGQSNVRGQIRTSGPVAGTSHLNAWSAHQPRINMHSGPSGAAAHPDLMPPGGFRNGRQQGMPTTGRGAASNINDQRNLAQGVRSNPYNRSSASHNHGNQPVTVNSNRNRQTFSNRNVMPSSSSNTRGNLPVDQPQCGTNQSVNNYGYGSMATQDTSGDSHVYSQNNWLGPRPPGNYMYQYGPSGHDGGAKYYNSYPGNHQQGPPDVWPVGYQPGVGTPGFPPLPHPSMYPRGWTPAQAPLYPFPRQQPDVGLVQQETDEEVEWDSNPPLPPTTKKRPTQCVPKPASWNPERGLQLVTMDIAGLRRWSEYKDKLQLTFEVYGYLDSAVARAGSDCKEFLLKDDNQDTVTCVFYEIDRNLPKMVRGQWQRVVGTYEGRKDRLRCVSVRGAQAGERKQVPDLIQASNATLSRLVHRGREP